MSQKNSVCYVITKQALILWYQICMWNKLIYCMVSDVVFNAISVLAGSQCTFPCDPHISFYQHSMQHALISTGCFLTSSQILNWKRTGNKPRGIRALSWTHHYTLTIQWWSLTSWKKKSIKNIFQKAFSPLHTILSILWKTNVMFWVMFNLLSANAFNLDKAKIL